MSIVVRENFVLPSFKENHSKDPPKLWVFSNQSSGGGFQEMEEDFEKTQVLESLVSSP